LHFDDYGSSFLLVGFTAAFWLFGTGLDRRRIGLRCAFFFGATMLVGYGVALGYPRDFIMFCAFGN